MTQIVRNNRDVKHAQPIAISLFSGAGGMDLGVEQAGFHTACRLERDEHCAATLRRNNAEAVVIQDDIRNVDPHGLLKRLGLKPGETDLIHGGPPCQPFSAAGLHTGMAHKDGEALFEFVKFVGATRPKAILCEQVEGLLKHHDTFERFLESIKRLGYNVHHTVINATDIGVAQGRKRVFVVGFLKPHGRDFKFCIPKHTVTCSGDVLTGLPKPAEGEPIPNHVDCTPARDKERISYVPEGGWLSKSGAPESIIRKLTPKDTTKYRRLDRGLPSLTLRCGEIFFHPYEDRYLTPREYMRLHGYPDTYVLEGPVRRRTGTVKNLDQHRQVANSVPPPLAKHLANLILEQLCT